MTQVTPRVRSKPTTASSTHSAQGSSDDEAENRVLRDVARWFTTVIIPVLLLALLGYTSWLNITLNGLGVQYATLSERVANGQQDRQSDNAELATSINDLKTAVAHLGGSIDTLSTAQASQAANMAVLMDQHNNPKVGP